MASFAFNLDVHRENHVTRHVPENEHAVRAEAARRGLIYCNYPGHGDVCITRPGYLWGYYTRECPRCHVENNPHPQSQPSASQLPVPQQPNLPFHLLYQGKKIRFQNQACNRFMHVTQTGGNGTLVHLWHDIGPHEHGMWYIEDIKHDAGEYVVGIRLTSKRLYLNLDCGKLYDGTKVHMWGDKATGNVSNQWILRYVSEDIVNIIPINSVGKNHFLNADRGTRDQDGGKIHLWCDIGEKASNQWKMIIVD